MTSGAEGARQLWIKYGYEIPIEGDITGGILGNGFLDGQTMNAIVELSQYPDLIVPKEVFNPQKYISSIYLCFNDCPVSKKYFGRIWKIGDNMIILTEEVELDSSREDKVCLTFIKDKKIERKLEKYIK